MNATQLLLFTDPDVARSTPPGYTWPADGSGGSLSGNPAGMHGALSTAGLAGLVIGLCAGLVLAGVIVWMLLMRRGSRRRGAGGADGQMGLNSNSFLSDKHVFASVDVGGGGSSNNSMYGSRYGSSSKDRDSRMGAGAMHGRAADVAASSTLTPDQQQQYQGLHTQSIGASIGTGRGGVSGELDSVSGTGSNGGVLGNKRWQKLTNAISSKVQDIHQQRLRTAFMQAQRTGVVSLGGSNSPPFASRSPGLGRSSGGGPGSSSSLQHANNNSGSNNSGTMQHVAAGGSGASMSMFGGSEQREQQQLQDDGGQDARDTFELKELIGRGTFGTVYR